MGNSVVTVISADNRKKNDCGDFAVYSNSIAIMIYFSLTFRFMKYSKANEMNVSQVERKVLIFIQISQNSASSRSNHGILPKRNISKGYLKSSKKKDVSGCDKAAASLQKFLAELRSELSDELEWENWAQSDSPTSCVKTFIFQKDSLCITFVTQTSACPAHLCSGLQSATVSCTSCPSVTAADAKTSSSREASNTYAIK